MESMSLKVRFLKFHILCKERRIDIYSHIYFLFRDFASSASLRKWIYLLWQVGFQRLTTCVDLSFPGRCLPFWWSNNPQEVVISIDSWWWKSFMAISPFSTTSLGPNSCLQWESALSWESSSDTIWSRRRQSSENRFPMTHGCLVWR